MSSTYNHTSSTFVGATTHGSREHPDDLDVSSHPSHTPFDPSLLSPFDHSHTLSNSASPSYNVNSTPGESEYSSYQPSELSEADDEFFGVDFDAGVQRVDSIPAHLLGNLAGPPVSTTAVPYTSLQSKRSLNTTTSTYPLSPGHTNIPSTTPSPQITHEFDPHATVSPHELTNTFPSSPKPQPSLNAPTSLNTTQLTPDTSGSSHTSAEGVEPSKMNHLEQSPQVTISQWGSRHLQPPSLFDDYGNHVNPQFPVQPTDSSSQATLRDDEGTWRSSERTGQAGLDPEARKMMLNQEIPSLKEQEKQRHLDSKNFEVQEWRSQAGGSSDGDEEHPSQSYFNLAGELESVPPEIRPEENGIAPLDDNVSVHENRLVEGQVYWNPRGTQPTDADAALVNQSRHWNDPPQSAYVSDSNFQQPATAMEAIMKWNGNADAMSLASRAATWGTRRRSETNLADAKAVTDGSFLKKLSISSRSKEGNRPRNNSIFDQGLDRLANMVRNRSDSKLKRGRSSQNLAEIPQEASNSRHNSQGSLVPRRSSSSRRKQGSTVNTAVAAMTGSLVAVGATHARSGSVATSPKSPTHLGFARSVMQRARSKSDLTSQDRNSQSSLVGLWRGHGGPPVPNLASPPMEPEVKPQVQPEPQEQDDDDDDDADGDADESDLKLEFNQPSEPIIPNYEGFKAHVRRLNPDMDPGHSWLVSRIAHQQEIRYKNLLELRVKHSQAIVNRNCSAGRHCMSLGGSATLLDIKGKPREPEQSPAKLQLVTDFSDDSNPGEGALTDETFPSGVPMPPSRNLPAEFECQLCFKTKKFTKPSDWTKHVHEDVQPFTCTYEKCKEPKSFKRKADWVRHENERHRHLEWWICQIDDCRHPCYRKDNFLQHLVREHKLPEPKQKTKTAIKKARSTEQAWVFVEQCRHETPKKPQDEACKFCGKTFHTWKKLTVHLAKHMEHISLPILHLVEARAVDANTIISPVEQIFTPITPDTTAKMESSSPFPMDSIAQQMPMNQQYSGFEQPGYYATSDRPVAYRPQGSMQQEVSYAQNSMYPNAFGANQMPHQSDVFGPSNSNSMHSMAQARPYASLDSTGTFSQTRPEQPRGFSSIDASFSPGVPGPMYNTHPAGYVMPQDFSTASAMSGYQDPSMLGVSDVGYGFDGLPITNAQTFVPMTRAQGSASSYGHSPQNVPQNVQYYGHH